MSLALRRLAPAGSRASPSGGAGRCLAVLAAALSLVAVARSGSAQSVQLRVESREMYAGLPFILSVSATGFDEEPTPDVSSFEIQGCKVTPLGVAPSVSSSISIINGQRSESHRVTFVYRYRVEAPAAGNYTIAPVRVTQGTKQATTPASSFRVQELAATQDMKVRLNLPDRPVWLGETFEVTLDWFINRDVGDHSFVVPLFDLEDAFQVEAPPAEGRRVLAFSAGTRQLQLPLDADDATLGGARYRRFRFTARVTPNRAGRFELEPVRVAALLQVGMGQDSFGFRVPRQELFKAEDVARTLEVRGLPQQERPASFVNAVGTAFSLNVRAGRTVVRVGDPVELELLVRGDGRLEGLSLPPLARAEGGLSPELFSIADESPSGELLDDGKGKRFVVTVRLKSADVSEIPPLTFAYFDPEERRYRTVESEPVALSVTGSATVGAADIVPSRALKPAEPAIGARDEPAASAAPAGSLVGADLSLSPEGRTLRARLSPGLVRLLVALLYAGPLVLLGVRLWRLRTSERRGYEGDVGRAFKELERELANAASLPARESGPRVLSALRALARLSGSDIADGKAAFERLETEAFDPSAAGRPLADSLRTEARSLGLRWSAREKTAANGRRAVVALLALSLAASAPVPVRAEPSGSAARLAEARGLYQQALSETDRTQRTHTFAAAEAIFGELALAHPTSPELLADWGSSALGAQELGRATLAYRRTLAIEPGHERARRNLAWVRQRAPAWLPRPGSRGAVDSLIFWHSALSPAERQLLAASGFALGILLCVPWVSARRARALRRLAIVPFVVFIAAAASLLLDADPRREAVVMVDFVRLRSADSLGAPAALPEPLPAGAEVAILETRDAWARVALADGSAGWLSSAALERVSP